jgi:hypothetical protein
MFSGDRDKNVWLVVAVICVSVSIVTSMVGQIMFNTRTAKFVVKQNEDLAAEHARILQHQVLILEAIKQLETRVDKPK